MMGHLEVDDAVWMQDVADTAHRIGAELQGLLARNPDNVAVNEIVRAFTNELRAVAEAFKQLREMDLIDYVSYGEQLAQEQLAQEESA